MISQSLLDIADSLLYVSALLASKPRRIDGVIDYFGEPTGIISANGKHVSGAGIRP
jgi:hypothetical protein